MHLTHNFGVTIAYWIEHDDDIYGIVHLFYHIIIIRCVKSFVIN